MSKIIQETLEELDGYLISIDRNIENSIYQLKVGFEPNWVFSSNDNILCDVEVETDAGSIVTISGKHDEVYVDDLIEFVKKIVEHNYKIAKKREEFEKELELMRQSVEDRILEFQNEMELEESASFDENDDDSEMEVKRKNFKEEGEKLIEDEDINQKIN